MFAGTAGELHFAEALESSRLHTGTGEHIDSQFRGQGCALLRDDNVACKINMSAAGKAA